jgi:hypothetical protein
MRHTCVLYTSVLTLNRLILNPQNDDEHYIKHEHRFTVANVRAKIRWKETAEFGLYKQMSV